MRKLSHAEQRAVRHAMANPRGLIEHPMRLSNFDNPEKRMGKLCALGLLEPAHKNAWRITEAGRKWASENPI